MRQRKTLHCIIVCGALAFPTCGFSATIESWNLGNIAVPDAPPPDGETGFSLVFDAAAGAPAATLTGRIAFTPPEATVPGLTVENGAYRVGGPSADFASGCLRASAETPCDGEFQSGKRFKQQITGAAPMDLVFDVDPSGVVADGSTPGIGYQVFHRVVNLTGALVDGFSVSLGFGVGDDFVPSTVDDGLGFSTLIGLGPDRVSSFSQYPFGLFGDPDTNPNFTLGGFFDTTSRAGFDLFRSEDMLTSIGFYGIYDDLFGSWLPEDMTPEGALWDNDGDPATDALIMAWYREDIQQWEIRRAVDPDDPSGAVSLENAVLVESFADVQAFLGSDIALFTDLVEDLANLNLNYAIDLKDGIDFTTFTLRVDLDTADIAPVPIPPMLPVFAIVLAGIGAGLRRHRARRETGAGRVRGRPPAVRLQGARAP